MMNSFKSRRDREKNRPMIDKQYINILIWKEKHII